MLPDKLATADFSSQDPLWNLKLIQTIEARELAKTNGRYVKIGIIDSGVNYEHSDLEEACKDACKGKNFIPGEDPNKPLDANGHGTFVAGIIAGKETGIAPEASIYSVKITNEREIERSERLRYGIRWCIENNMDIINISIGAPLYSDIVYHIIQKANKQNIIIVASAGNSATGARFPASYDKEVVSVAAVDQQKYHCIFSNIWPTVDISAPGRNVRSLHLDHHQGYRIEEGTSVAAPHVTGILALAMSLLKQHNRKANPKELEHLLKKTALDFSESKILKKFNFLLADYYTSIYDAQKVFLRNRKVITQSMYGAGLIQGKNFIEELIKNNKIDV